MPLLRGGRAIGVLVVQNRTERVYAEDEVEDLQIIAMVLAEMVAAGELMGLAELKDVEIAPHRPERLKGAQFAEGLAYGVAVLHEPPVAPEQLLSDDALAEEARLQDGHRRACRPRSTRCWTASTAWSAPPTRCSRPTGCSPTTGAGTGSLEEAVRSGLTAEAAVERVRSEHRARLGQARDPYLRERLHDLEDLNDRLLRHLSGDAHAARELPEDAILIARNLGPADLLEYDRTKLKGLLLEEGSAASHAGHRGPGPGHPLRRPPGRPARPGLRGRPGDRRRRDRRGLSAAARRRGQGAEGPRWRCAPSARPSSPGCATRRPSPRTAARSPC